MAEDATIAEQAEPVDQVDYWNMANLFPRRTGLDYVILISVQSGREKHGPRIKVRVDDQLVPVTIEAEPQWLSRDVKIPSKAFANVQRYIVENHDVLIEYWDSKIDTADVVERLKPIQ